MRLEYQILLAVGLDIIIGDPRWLPHPVKLMGRLAMLLERPLRRVVKSPWQAGAVAALLVVGITIVVTYLVVHASWNLHPFAGDAVTVVILYTGIAAGDMLKHSKDVWRALEYGDIHEARRRVGMICGRDTDNLDEPAVVQATIESVAENMVDGVTAPLFYAVLAGPVGIMAYKAVSTLDSTFGYKNERYSEFGWASARLDDIAAFVPSRLTAILVPIAALILGKRAGGSIKVFLRDRGKHPSPNAGQPESAMAGALGVQLGGLSYYQGKASHKPHLGDSIVPLHRSQILTANALLVATSLLMLGVLLGLRLCLPSTWNLIVDGF
jgi:adenosylcobinamide-phosphate synthase